MIFTFFNIYGLKYRNTKQELIIWNQYQGKRINKKQQQIKYQHFKSQQSFY